MATASASAASPLGISMATAYGHSSSHHHRILRRVGRTTTVSLPKLRSFHHLCFVAFARRRTNTNSTSSKKKYIKSRSDQNAVAKEENLDEDPLEELFQQLEDDLKSDNILTEDEDDEITEQDLANLERELEEALQADELVGLFDGAVNEATEKEPDNESYEGKEEADDDEEEEEMLVELKRWQLRRLAYALKNGRRKTSIKNLAADLCLDRSIVLKLLRDPPPDLLMLSAALPDKPDSTVIEPEVKSAETIPSENASDVTDAEVKKKVPVHEMQRSWSAQKRLKKVHVETLEKVYRRTKRPTNTMISSIVHVTNIPRKKVVKWFEDKRTEDGIPGHRVPYQRPASASVFTS